MNSLDLIKMGSKNLFRRKLRTFLTTLGIIIGTVSIVVMVSLGIGMKESYKKSLENIGSLNVIDVRPSQDNTSTTRNNRGKDDNLLYDEDIAKISSIEGVEAVSPIITTQIKLISGQYSAMVQVTGIKPELMEAFDYKVDSGRLLNQNDRTSLVFGYEVPYQFQNGRSTSRGRVRSYVRRGQGAQEQVREAPEVNVLEDRMSLTFDMSYGERMPSGYNNSNKKPIRPYKATGVGVLQQGDWQNNYMVFMPLDELQKLKDQYDRESGNSTGRKKEVGYQTIKVKIKNPDDVKTVQTKLEDLGYEVNSLMDMLDEMNKFTNIIQLIFGGIGGISLLVAAIGITNTMVMAIYERRKEIGVMKVIGASLNDIKKLFLFEASMIGFMGGLSGLLLSFLASKVLNIMTANVMSREMGQPTNLSVVPIWLAALAVAFTTIIGLVSGYLPARKAMKLSALEAIKTE